MERSNQKDVTPTVFIGNKNLYDWMINGGGNEYLYPEILIGCEELLYNNYNKVLCSRVESVYGGVKQYYDFIVTKKTLKETLQMVMNYGIKSEEYELCERVVNLRKTIKKYENREIQLEIDFKSN